MKTLISTIVLCLAYSAGALAQGKSYFPNLNKTMIDSAFQAWFGCDQSARLINRSCLSLDPKDPFYCTADAVVTGKVVAKYKAPGIADSLTILFDGGMSDDPEYSIFGKGEKLIGHISCVEFYINSSGLIYTAGHANNMYDRRRKYQIRKDTIVEIRQPYYYVGLKGQLLKDITLYQSPTGAETVAQLPKGYEIEVLLAESATKDYEMDYRFLVRTDFGLVGWLRIDAEDAFGGVLKGLYFAGD